MFGLGWPEVAIILGVAVVIFGPKKIPEIGKSLGQTMRGFKEELQNPAQNSESTDEQEK